MPIFTMMVGLPGSGKSYYAKQLSEETGSVIHSSVDIRCEICGNASDQSANQKVFDVLHDRVISDLLCGKSVIYDATNISYKRRMSFLSRIKKIFCEKHCVFMATPFEECLKRNESRDRVVPYEAIDRMYRNMWIPYTYEGWDKVTLRYPDGFRPMGVFGLFFGGNGLWKKEHDNPHHTLSIGAHCFGAELCVSPTAREEVKSAALLHDIGKPFTKTFVDCNGHFSDVAHYYDHQHISAYQSLFLRYWGCRSPLCVCSDSMAHEAV